MRKIIDQFRLEGRLASADSFGGGHINDTYRLRNGDPGAPDYLLQRINSNVFPDVAGLMRNFALVTEHIRQRITESEPPASDQTTLTLIPTRQGEWYYRSSDGGYWRVYEFLQDLHAHDLVSTPQQAYEGGRAYGYFLRFLDDFPAERLTEVIPGFHDLALRLKNFAAARAAAVDGREAHCREDIERVGKLSEQCLVIDRLHKSGAIRRRVTHNDTKFNNLLLTAEDKGKCVIDLDTVMPGIVHFDFGDGVRTGVSPAAEDEADLSKVAVDVEKFRGFATGYLEVTREVLSPVELEHLGLSGAYMAYIMGVRFLTDYLSGDVYYKVSKPDHNLVRARNQLRLAEEFLARLPELNRIVRNV